VKWHTDRSCSICLCSLRRRSMRKASGILGVSSCAVSIARPWYGPPLFVCPPWAGEPKRFRVRWIPRTEIFWAPPATDGAFLFCFSAHWRPAVPLWRRTQGHVGVFLARFCIWCCQGADSRKRVSRVSSRRAQDAARLEAVSGALVCSESRKKSRPQHVGEWWAARLTTASLDWPAALVGGLFFRIGSFVRYQVFVAGSRLST